MSVIQLALSTSIVVFWLEIHQGPYFAIEYWQIVTEGICGGLLKRPVALSSAACGSNAFGLFEVDASAN
ncbi:hypothetical protein KBB08_01525 [Candidatus Gracilibacteria bacterium]|nr:hypothetical protein [Candidatus Gracilibacteria bacterium]